MVEEMCTVAPGPNQESDLEEEVRFEAGLKAAMETAKKHGYYYSVLGEQERIDYVMALAHDDEDEIALLRAQIKAALATLGLSLGMRIDPNLLGALGRGGTK